MPKSLDVYLQSDLVGQLVQDTGGQMRFQYGESWLDGPGPAPLSQSLPLRRERFSQKERLRRSAANALEPSRLYLQATDCQRIGTAIERYLRQNWQPF